MGDENTHLIDLEKYIDAGWRWNAHEISKCRVEGILERTIKALEAGATPTQIKTVFAKYISAWQPDRSYG